MILENKLRRANDFVSRVKDEVDRKEFLSLAKRLPSLLLNSGLIVTVAYLTKKSREAGRGSGGREGSRRKMESLVLEYLLEELRAADLLDGEVDDLLDYLLNSEPEKIPLMLDGALSSFEALKLVVEARFGEGDKGETQS